MHLPLADLLSKQINLSLSEGNFLLERIQFILSLYQNCALHAILILELVLELFEHLVEFLALLISLLELGLEVMEFVILIPSVLLNSLFLLHCFCKHVLGVLEGVFKFFDLSVRNFQDLFLLLVSGNIWRCIVGSRRRVQIGSIFVVRITLPLWILTGVVGPSCWLLVVVSQSHRCHFVLFIIILKFEFKIIKYDQT